MTKSRFTGVQRAALAFWLLASLAISIWSFAPGYVVGWDLRVYENAVLSLRAGHDPYVDGTNVQREFHAHLAENAGKVTPFTYVYSPITLPLLRLIAKFPLGLSNAIYWTLYGLGLLAALLVCLQSVERQERGAFLLIGPATIFFPGLLQNDVLFSGNIAYLLYGAVLAAAYVGWRKGTWWWFYAAVLLTSCCKAPLLTLLAIPVFSARRQWIPAGLTFMAGVGLFMMQPLVWPTLFHNYLDAVELQFSFNHDFSSSPAGLLTDALYDYVPYKIMSTGFYLFYAIPLFGFMFYLSRKFLAGRFSLRQWIPVLLVGVVFLNPRIMEYDVAPVTVAMALIVWRVCARLGSQKATIIAAALVFAAINLMAQRPWEHFAWWRGMECLTIVGLFAAGSWNLLTGTLPTHNPGVVLLPRQNG